MKGFKEVTVWVGLILGATLAGCGGEEGVCGGAALRSDRERVPMGVFKLRSMENRPVRQAFSPSKTLPDVKLKIEESSVTIVLKNADGSETSTVYRIKKKLSCTSGNGSTLIDDTNCEAF